MKTLKFIGVLTLFIALVSCDKNQQAVKKLDGTWRVTETTIDNGQTITTTTYSDVSDAETYRFDKCKLKKDEYCNVTITSGNIALPYEYRVVDDGTKLEVKIDVLGSSTTSTMTIVELKKKSLKLQTVYGGTTSTSTLEKID